MFRFGSIDYGGKEAVTTSLDRWFAIKKNSRKTRGDKGKIIMVFWWRIGGCFGQLEAGFVMGFLGS